MTCVIWNIALVCLESVSFVVIFMHGLRLMHHSLRNHFGSTCRYFGEEPQVEARFDLLGDSANLDARLVHDLQGTYASKSIWMHPMDLLDDVCQMESCFGLFVDIVSFSAR